MANRFSKPIGDRLRRAGPPLANLAPERSGPALAAKLARALGIERAERDRLVIFEPAVAPLIRPLIDAADVAPWHVAASGRWIIAVPAARAVDLAQHHPNLARQLAALPAPAALPTAVQPWWALPDGAEQPAAPPRLIVAGQHVAWDETQALVGGPATVIAGAEPYWLALMASAVGRLLLAEGEVARFPIPDAPGPARASLAGLALSAANLAAQRAALEQAVIKRLVADFGPPGVPPGPRLRRWWELSFAELVAAINAELRNDLPPRYRPTWAEIHADQQATHAEASARLVELEQAIDAQAATLFGLSAAEAQALAAR